ncbi:hypothetical protein [Endozoicomonas numazuensis]|uniref:Uncharacterized protein n=1 Tax=Endozoicomonas numazuensis TaxID=1137799 RepID=A0A081NCN5_9GAMM|nr:hypothetical protein [Endozoicomonas numazuensis]KEQ16208.1 hypothetical protein GZ78_23540 [Endozoicomonas numazuensis]
MNINGRPTTPVNRHSVQNVAAAHRELTSNVRRSSLIGGVSPQGSQNLSLSDPPSRVFNLSKNIVFGNNQIHFEKGSNLSDKATVAAGQARHLIGKASSLTLLGMKISKYQKTAESTYKIPNEGFSRSFTAFSAINIAAQGLMFIKSAGETVYNAVRDIGAHSSRKESQALLEDYDPEKRSFKSGANHQERHERLQTLVGKKGSDLSRSKGQVVLDRLTQVAGLSEQATDTTHSAMLLAESSSKIAARAVPGLGIALSAINTVYSAIRTGSQVSALNNLAKAKSATQDPLLKALADHIKQERTFTARKHLVNTTVNLAMTGVGIGLTASGVGAPAAFIGAGVAAGAVSIGSTALTAWHGRKLAKAREKSDLLMQSGRSMESMAKENIGVAEKAFLSRLRSGDGEELKEAVVFLRRFGLTENTIKKLQLAPEQTALKTLKKVLYQDKVKYKGLQLKQTAKTLAHVVGLTALAKRIKSGTLWLMAKLKPQGQTSVVQSPGSSLADPPVNQPDSRRKRAYAFMDRSQPYPSLSEYQRQRMTV